METVFSKTGQELAAYDGLGHGTFSGYNANGQAGRSTLATGSSTNFIILRRELAARGLYRPAKAGPWLAA
jgi:hypothetical protein